MSRLFAYARVSTLEQTVQNQIVEIQTAGFQIEPHRLIVETISGAVPMMQRPSFVRLLDRLEAGDVLIVTKLDRLGRNAMDVSTTVSMLEDRLIKVYCLALGGVDLTSAAGQLTMGVLNAVAQFERDLLIERTQAGLARAKAQGKIFGRPQALSQEQQSHVQQRLQAGESISSVAKAFKVSRQTVIRVRDRLKT